MTRLFAMCMVLGLLAGCDDAKTEVDAGADQDGSVLTCGAAPSDAPNCGLAQCPSSCNQASMCGRSCGSSDCYTCSAGTWTRVYLICVGMVCASPTPDAGAIVVPDAAAGDR